MQVDASPEGVTRSDLVHRVNATVPSVPRAMVRDLLEGLLEEIAQTLINGEAVRIRSFGNFVVRAKAERIGRNPRSGESAIIKPRRVVTFKPSPMLLAIINNEAAPAEQP